MINIKNVRTETVGCHDKIFLNSAGSSLVPRPVHQKVIEYLEKEEEIGGYKLSDVRKSAIGQFYSEAARLINCKPRNIAFASNASEAFSKALSTIDFKKGDVIITTDDDYVSNYINFITLRERYGIIIKRINNLENGDLDINHFEDLIRIESPKLVSVTHIPTNSGLIQDIESIGHICNQKEIIYLVDACQSTGQIDVDVTKIKCDFLSTTGRKFLRGPRGTGFLYVSDRMLKQNTTPLYIELGGAKMSPDISYKAFDDAKRFEMWEKPFALVVGLAEAIKYANQIGIENIDSYNQNLNSNFRKKLEEIPNLLLHDKGTKKASIITISMIDKTMIELTTLLDQHNIYYSTSKLKGAPIDYAKKNLDWTIRLSPHYFNTPSELEQVVEVLKGV